MALRSLTLPPPSVHIDGEGATGPEVGQYTALTLSSAGTEYISYFDGTQGDLNLAARVSTGRPQGRLRARQHHPVLRVARIGRAELVSPWARDLDLR